MLLDILGILALLAPAWAVRDTSKAFKSMPAISNSLVNLGKMDISFHFDSKTPPGLSPFREPGSLSLIPPSESLFYYESDPMMNEPCLCSAMRNIKSSFLTNPSDIISKILKSNNLFSQEPMVSPVCCDSHEHIQEDAVFFEFGPKPPGHMEHMSLPQLPSQPNVPMFPLIWDNLAPHKPPMPSIPSPLKPKAIEIFFFPKKKDLNLKELNLNPFDISKLKADSKKKEVGKKNEIQIVGDKELRNEFKSLKYRPSLPLIGKKEEQWPEETVAISTQEPKKEPNMIVEEISYNAFPQDNIEKTNIEKTEEEKKEEDKEQKRLEEIKQETPVSDTATVSVTAGPDDSTTFKPLNII